MRPKARLASTRPPAARFAGRSVLALAALLSALGALPAMSARAADVPTRGALYQDGPSGRYLLGGEWYARPDPDDSGERLAFYRAKRLAGWAPATVPSASNAGDFSNSSYLGQVQWYRKDFVAPAAPPRIGWKLRFESVNYHATVWLNGRPIGRHAGAYLPFELDAGLLRRGVNRLVVRVDSRRTALDVPSLAVRRDGRFLGGWWNYTGILREVYLRRVDTLDLTHVLVRPRLRCRTCRARIAIDVLVQNMGRQAATPLLEARVGDRTVELEGEPVGPKRVSRLRTSIELEKPRLWSPAHPHLYAVRLRLLNAGERLLQRYDLHTGVRSLEVRRGRLLLNGRPVSLRGASMHEDDPLRGAALRPEDIRANVDLLRNLGATMTRAHYPMHPLTLELADRYGIVVWSEIPVYQMQDSLFRNDRVRQLSVRMLREMILRDRNHPSIAVWSVGNENTQKPGPGFRRYVRQARRAVTRLDPTRLVGVAFPGYPTIGRLDLYAGLDALGINDYFGWYPGPANSIANREGVAAYLDTLHAYYPRRALFVTEFGAEANRSGPVTEKGTFEFQRDFLAYHLSVFAQRPWINGAMVWILRDFRVKPGYDGGNPAPQPPMNFKGIVDDRGVRKPAWDVLSRDFHALAGAQP